ncbi:MAG: AI-2E family transporter [Desulfatibacillaceae bacterium]
MLLDERPYTLDRIVRIAIAVGLVWGVIRLLGYLSEVLFPFAVALLLAYLINPAVAFVQRKIKGRLVAVLLTLFVLFVVLAGVAALIIPQIVSEIQAASSVIVSVANNSDIGAGAAEIVPEEIWHEIRDWMSREDVMSFLQTDNFISLAQTAARKLLPGVWGVISGTTSVMLGAVGLSIILLYLVFLLLDFDKVREEWNDFIPAQYRDQVRDFVHEFNGAMQRYFRGQALVAGIVGILHAIGFSIIGLPLGILLGLFIGLLNMVPYLQILGMIPALLMAVIHALATDGSILTTLALTLLVFAVIQTIQDGFLVPKIMGDVTGLSPAMILLSLSVWGKLLGMFGLLIALPVTCLLLAYYRRFIGSTTFVVSPGEGDSVPVEQS